MLGRVLIMLLLCTPALAHDHKRPDLNDWYNSLKSSNGNLCCTNMDGTALDDIDWDMTNGHYRVRLQGRWIDVPDSALVTVPNLSGRAVVWPSYLNGEAWVRCFMPGSMG